MPKTAKKCPKLAAAYILELTDQLVNILHDLTIESTFEKGKAENQMDTNNLVEALTKALTPAIENITGNIKQSQPTRYQNPNPPGTSPPAIDNSEKQPISWTTVVKKKTKQLNQNSNNTTSKTQLVDKLSNYTNNIDKIVHIAREAAESEMNLIFIDSQEKIDPHELLKRAKQIINPRLVRIDDIGITAKGGLAVKESQADRQAI